MNLRLPKPQRQRVRAISRWLRGDGVFYLRELRCSSRWHGGKHGWMIAPDDLSGDSVVYSFGIGDDISFDLSLIETYGMRVHAFDPSPGMADWLATRSLPLEFQYHPLALSGHDGTGDFFRPAPGRKCHTLNPCSPDQQPVRQVPVRRLRTIMKDLGHDHLDVLKIDIEGSEYEVLDDMLREQIPVRQLLIEFHHRFPTLGAAMTKRAISELSRHGYRIFWVSPSCNEYSLLNTRLVNASAVYREPADTVSAPRWAVRRA